MPRNHFINGVVVPFTAEEETAQWILDNNFTKPIVAFIAGQTASGTKNGTRRSNYLRREGDC